MFTGMFLSQALGVFGTGILASLSPCVYPMLPITLGFLGSQSEGKGSKKAVISYTLGQCLALFILGIVAVQIGETFGFSSQSRSVQLAIGGFLVLAGIVSWRGRLPAFLSRLNVGSGLTSLLSRGGLFAAFLLGVSAALVASPCTSPILGGVLALMATASSFQAGMLLMLFYSMGFSLLFLLLGLGVLRMNRLPRSGRWLQGVHKLNSLFLIGAGTYYLLS